MELFLKKMDHKLEFSGQFNVKIYWGTPQQFVNELHAEWQNYQMMSDELWDDWDEELGL